MAHLSGGTKVMLCSEAKEMRRSGDARLSRPLSLHLSTLQSTT